MKNDKATTSPETTTALATLESIVAAASVITVDLSDSQRETIGSFVARDNKKRDFDTWFSLVIDRGIRSIEHTFDHAEKAKMTTGFAKEVLANPGIANDPAALHALIEKYSKK